MKNSQNDFAKFAGVLFVLTIISEMITGVFTHGFSPKVILACLSFGYMAFVLFKKGKNGKLLIAIGLSVIAFLRTLSLRGIIAMITSGDTFSVFYGIGVLLYLIGLSASAVLAFLPNKEEAVYNAAMNKTIDSNALTGWWVLSALFFVVGFALKVVLFGGQFDVSQLFTNLGYCLSDFLLLIAVFFSVRVTIDSPSNEDPSKAEEKKQMANASLKKTLIAIVAILVAFFVIYGLAQSGGSSRNRSGNSRTVTCNYCHGSGRAGGERCPWCNGSGKTYDNYFNDLLGESVLPLKAPYAATL